MNTAASINAAEPRSPRRLWGLTPIELHDRYWMSRSVKVVRRGMAALPRGSAELHLLTDAHTLLLFDLRRAVNEFAWVNPTLLSLRLRQTQRGVFEPAADDTDAGSPVTRFQRTIARLDELSRVGLATSASVAACWRQSQCSASGWKSLRRGLPQRRRAVLSDSAILYDARDARQSMGFVAHLAASCRRPDAFVDDLAHVGANAWTIDPSAMEAKGAVAGLVWAGRGRQVIPEVKTTDPIILWDLAPAPVQAAEPAPMLLTV